MRFWMRILVMSTPMIMKMRLVGNMIIIVTSTMGYSCSEVLMMTVVMLIALLLSMIPLLS